MSEVKKKNYVGNGKAIVNQYGTLFNLSLKLDELLKLPTNDKGYIRISMSQLKEADKFGNTHTVYENDYKPQQRTDANEDVFKPSESVGQDIDSSLPF